MKQPASYYSALRIIIGCCLFFITLQAAGQTKGSVEVIKDPRIDTLAARMLETGRGSATGDGGISAQGYRVQFFFGSNRAAAYAAQTRLQEHFPDIRTYISYREPNFKVHAGDFRTRLEAAKLVQQLRPLFPTLFIISEKINPPLP